MQSTTGGPLGRLFRSSRAACGAGCWLMLAACSDEVSAPRPLSPGNIRTAVTQDLAAKLGPDGRFVLPAAPAKAYPQLSGEEATQIAVAWARTFGKYVRNEFERLHGKPIDFDALRPGAPAYYAAAAYDPVPADAHAGLRNAFGPQYLVYLVDDEGPVISVAVAAFSQARVENGRMRLPLAGGMEVVPDPIRRADGFVAPLSPEQAVSLVNRATGARIAAVPELVMPPRGYHPQHSRWRVTLETPVEARRGGQPTREVYVGLRGQLSVPAPAQPAGASVFDPSTQRTIPLTRRASRPVSFDRADFPRR